MLAWLLTAAIPALALEPIVVNDHVSDLSIGRKNLELLLDPDDRLRLNDFLQPDALAFTPLQQDVLNLGHSDDSVWLHLQLQPDADTQSNLIWLLQLQFPLLDRVDIYPVRNGKADTPFHIGYSIPMADRPFKHRFFVQPLQVEPGQRLDVYVNIMREGGAVQAPLRLSTPTAFFFAETSSNHAMGIYFGIMIAMIIYNFFLLFSVGNRSYFYYIVYICFTILTIQTFTGYGYLFLWPDQPWMNQYVTQIVSVMAVITGTLFTRNFVKFERYSNWMIPFTNAGIGLGVLLILARIFSNNFLSLEIVAYCSLMLFSAPIIVFMCWRRGSRQAGFFLLAWGLFLAGALMFTATLLGLLPSNTFTTNGMMLGSAAEVLMLSLGLADRINRERKEKYQMLQEQNKTMLRLKEAEDRLIHRALHNRTTGLPNRNFLRNTLDNLITAEQDNFQFSLLLVSLNNFHEFNKTLGHSNGDAILRIITERLSLLSRDMPGALAIERSQDRNHFVAGVEGVTFAMLLQGSSSQELLEPVHKFLHNLEKPFEYHNLTLDVDATCGLAHYPDHGTTSENLMRNAHIALEAASGNKQKLALYSPEIDPYNARRLSLLGELRHAIEQDALQLYFQPQISLRDFSVAGAEVLIRWIHPEYGFIPPDEFIPLAERTGVIHPLTYWICKHAFAFKHDLEMQGIDIHLSINISARNLQDPHFVREVARLADEAGISLKRIIMELTETAVMTDPEDALRVMTELNGQGIRLSIDDFGTGYSSLSYLKQLPVDEIKIDRSFVMEMAKNNDDQVIVHTTLTMGHNLSMEVVAEGIEDATTLRKLKDMGCDLAQGYHIAKPMPAADFFTWLSKYQASLENDAASKDVRRQG
ncbi:MAG TPA: EAL domain-containing protein [Dongiaceae bacterium]|nr:EAL domain-containing protein [Dongiaceae bacterium]